MIRRLVDQAFNSGKYYISAVGLSTDVKPTEGIITGSKFVEVDTGIGYLFDETSGEWHENQQLSAAVQAYFEDHPEAIDQAAIEAMFGEQLDGIEEDIGGLKSALTDFKSDISKTNYQLNTYGNTKFSITKKPNEYINGVGSYQSSNGYDSYEFKANEETKIYFDGTFAYLTMAVYSAAPVSSDTIVGSRMKDATIPTSATPYTVQAGYYVVITVYSDALAFYSDYRNYQIIEGALENVYAYQYQENTHDKTDYTLTDALGEYAGSDGALVENSGYNSYIIVGTEASGIYFDDTEFDYLSFCVYNGTPSASTLVGTRMREGTLPNENNPYILPAGYYGVISIQNSDTLSFYSNYKNIVFNSGVRLAPAHVEQVMENVCGIQYRLNTQYNTAFSITPKPGKYTAYDGSYTDNDGYNSYEIIGTENAHLYFDSTGFGYLSLCVYNGTPSSSTLVGTRMREDTLPTQSNPYTLPAGYYAVISIATVDTLAFYSDYKNLELNSDISLSPAQLQQAAEAVGTNRYRLYVTNDIQSDHITISMYTQMTDNKKLRIDMYKYVYGPEITTANANSNVWVMGGVYLVSNSLAVLDTVILPLEWDCAIKEVGASDFMGGKQHGDEIYDAYYIYADGVLLDPTQALTPFYCDSIQLVQTSKLNRVGDPTDYLLKHSKHIEITPKSVFCEQSFKALQTFQVNLSYSAMLPIDPDYADAFIRNGKAELENINDSGYTVTTTRGNDVWANIVADNSIIRFEANSDSDLTPAFAITKGTNDRKCYYTMNADDTTWAQDKILFSHYHFTFNVS